MAGISGPRKQPAGEFHTGSCAQPPVDCGGYVENSFGPRGVGAKSIKVRDSPQSRSRNLTLSVLLKGLLPEPMLRSEKARCASHQDLVRGSAG